MRSKRKSIPNPHYITYNVTPKRTKRCKRRPLPTGICKWCLAPVPDGAVFCSDCLELQMRHQQAKEKWRLENEKELGIHLVG